MDGPDLLGACGLPVNRFATLDELAVTPLHVAMAAGVVFTGSKAAGRQLPVRVEVLECRSDLGMVFWR
jgi:hypothetical protein